MPEWKKPYPGVEDMNVAVMGCIVNGPGESKHANIGISLPGTGESPAAPVFVDGQKIVTLRGERIVEEFQDIVLDYVQTNYGKTGDIVRSAGTCENQLSNTEEYNNVQTRKNRRHQRHERHPAGRCAAVGTVREHR